MFNQPPMSGTFPFNKKDPIADPGVARQTGLMGLTPGGYRGPGTVNQIGRAGTDFSNFPGGQSGGMDLMQGGPPPLDPNMLRQQLLTPNPQVMGGPVGMGLNIPSLGGPRGQRQGY